jgi:TRAP-type C4-dicarboxylate transport system permease small subunit
VTGTGSRRFRSFPHRLRHALGDVAALVYLALCAVLLVWALVVSAGDSSGESMAGVIPLLATAPASLVLLVLPDGAAMLAVAVAFGALVNASVIGWCARALRRGNRPDPAP